jgi:DNA-binding response OmpR family regulator
MIVDDDEFIRLTIRELFKTAGIHVVSAESANKCLQELEKGFQGVVLMDIMMPGKDGWDAIRMIKDKGLLKGNIVAMLTAKDVPDEKMLGLQEYVTDYITKPFEGEELIAAVKEYFGYLEHQNKES